MWEEPGAHGCMATNQMKVEMQLRRGGIWSPVTPIISCGRAETLALLCEAATKNAVQAPNPVPHQRRERGLGFFLHAHPSCPPLYPVLLG